MMDDQDQWMSEDDKERGEMPVSEAGRKGGEKTKETHGPQFYEEIGKKGGQTMKELVERGKEETGEEENQ